MIRTLIVIVALTSSVPGSALVNNGSVLPVTALPVTAPVTIAASPAPERTRARTQEKFGTAPHVSANGRKSLPAFGYMKQATDDPDGLSRIVDQARQLRPPR
jgi:hypothetical protein